MNNLQFLGDFCMTCTEGGFADNIQAVSARYGKDA